MYKQEVQEAKTKSKKSRAMGVILIRIRKGLIGKKEDGNGLKDKKKD